MRSSAARAEAAERRLLQAQRLESLSVLAGGIAHQLNNLLVVIMGNASLAATALDADDPLRQYLVEIESASQQAARLARQMLAYSGRGGFVVRPVDLNEVVRSACAAFTERVPAARRLRLELAPAALRVAADETQIAQLVLNLVVNAAEAIGGAPGDVLLATCGRRGRPGRLRARVHRARPAGRRATGSSWSTDTGEGISPDTAARHLRAVLLDAPDRARAGTAGGARDRARPWRRHRHRVRARTGHARAGAAAGMSTTRPSRARRERRSCG